MSTAVKARSAAQALALGKASDLHASAQSRPYCPPGPGPGIEPERPSHQPVASSHAAVAVHVRLLVSYPSCVVVYRYATRCAPPGPDLCVKTPLGAPHGPMMLSP